MAWGIKIREKLKIHNIDATCSPILYFIKNIKGINIIKTKKQKLLII